MDSLSSLNSTSRVLPEEILEKIISYALLPGFTGVGSVAETPASTLPLVCKAFNRIAKPLLYSHLCLRTRDQSERLAGVLSAKPALCAFIRSIRVEVPSASRAFLVAAEILSNSQEHSNRVLDVLDVGLICEHGQPACGHFAPGQVKEDLGCLTSALRVCPDTKCLVVRQDAYVRWNSVIPFYTTLASCVNRWQSLEVVDMRTRPMSMPSTSSSPRPDPLAIALAKAPKLRVFRARQPTLLNSFLLDVANNPALQRIELTNTVGGSPDQASPISPCFFPPHMRMEGCRFYDADSVHASTSRRSDTVDKRPLGDFGPDPTLLEAAIAKLEAQLETEPQTLFASQIVAHPRLCELIRAGRLELIKERLLTSRNGRPLGGDSCQGAKPCSASAPHACTFHGAGKSDSSSTYSGCLAFHSGV